ncbi:polyprotein [Plakobranchus ocellatus]|uniref:Polyprotein n=1 Tax=Plakobranchus ocellatus TaxID=259542 RepID=A0AAV4E1A6_9GAST|nr:polyprotein [Plakobranchus ocellatus]
MKEVIGLTQNGRKGLGSGGVKSWSKTESKEKRDIIIDEIRLEENSRRTQKAVLAWNEIWHMAPFRISFHIRIVYDLLSSNTNLVQWRMKAGPTCPLCQCKQTTEHVLSSCKVALSQAGTRGGTAEF